MEVTFRLLSGKTFVLFVEPEESVERVQTRVAEHEGVGFDEIRLIFAGKTIADGRTLADYNIQRESTIHVVPRGR
jgi:ubiquitin C